MCICLSVCLSVCLRDAVVILIQRRRCHLQTLLSTYVKSHRSYIDYCNALSTVVYIDALMPLALLELTDQRHFTTS